ncbi:hypothetical protein N7492_005454 [Penicillium capsulatum]|uniref:Siderophore biosynthesis enzyme n=1 Tax=Penicillium capsulatum TaxID=69766 RepID=A0A9W9ICH9_9EURO|nr:hypothetical protein N7492_005454 [Penicillium capsulatum]KAJ6135445.1 hypothetical protein N7512_000605 [Penicillium capsulatum]
MIPSTLSVAASLVVLARTVLGECGSHSFTHCEDNIVHWFDPNTGEVCDPLDCGGGRAPPRKDQPGCPLYTGTKVRTTSYLSCWTPSVSASSTSATGSSDAGVVYTTSVETKTGSTVAVTVTSTSTMASSTHGASGSSASPSTTSPPARSAANSTQSSSSAASSSTSTPNAADSFAGSMMAVAGAAIGAMALV